MKRKVGLTDLANQDIDDIHAFILDREGPGRAESAFDGLMERIATLESVTERGHVPPELEGMGVKNTLELHFKPYRIVYQVSKTNVVVFLVADGRRNFSHLLSNRLVL